MCYNILDYAIIVNMTYNNVAIIIIISTLISHSVSSATRLVTS